MSTSETGSMGPKSVDQQPEHIKTESLTKAKPYKFGDTIKGLYNKYISKKGSEPKSLENKNIINEKQENKDTKITQISQVTTELFKGKQYENMRDSELKNLSPEELELAKQQLTLLIKDLDTKYHSYDSQIKEIQTKLDGKSDELSNLNEAINKNEKTIANTKEKLEQKELENKEIDNNKNTCFEQFQINKDEINLLTNQIKTNEDNIKLLDANIDQCGLDQLKNSFDLEKKIQNLEKEIKEYKKYIKETPSDSPYINKQKLEDVKLALKNAESQLVSSQNKSVTIIEEATKTKLQMQTDITKSKKTIEQNKELLTNKKEMGEIIFKKLSSLQSQQKISVNELDKMRGDFLAQKNDNNELKMKKSSLEQEILRLNKVLDGTIEGPVMDRKKKTDIPSKYAKDKLNTVQDALILEKTTSKNQIKI